MRSFSRGARPDRRGGFGSKARDAARTSVVLPESDIGRERRLIQIANGKKQLLAVLREYGLHPENAGPWDEWSESITCPFHFHKGGKERTPSFGYNFRRDYFYCLGCGSSGQAVEFIAFKEGLERIAVAEQIIQESGGYELDDDLDEENIDYETPLFEFSAHVCSLIQKNSWDPENVAEIEKVAWWVDMYLLARVPRKKIDVEALELRLSRAREMLQEFE